MKSTAAKVTRVSPQLIDVSSYPADTEVPSFQRRAKCGKCGGKLHDAIEGDWPMMVIEPVPSKDWAALVNAASYACRTPDIGGKLYGLIRGAGFSDIDVRVVTRPDTDGRLLPMAKNMAEYARGSGKINDADKILSTIERAVLDGSYLALAPQFVVTATR